MNKSIQSYLKTMVETSTPLQNIILLNEKCLLHLANAREAMALADVGAKAEAVRKALDILLFLDNSLDFSGGGEAAAQLHNTYQLFVSQLTLANSRNDAALIAGMEKRLHDLLTAWKEMERQDVLGA